MSGKYISTELLKKQFDPKTLDPLVKEARRKGYSEQDVNEARARAEEIAKIICDGIDLIPAADVEPVVRDGCEYHCDNADDSPWECNKCEAAWTLESGNPFDNNMNYCSECGRPIRSIRFNEWYYNSDEDCGDREVVITREEYDAATEPKGGLDGK